MTKKQILIFSDFDGTLLDHYNYSFDAAKPCIERFKAENIPIMANTSKTFAEVKKLLHKMGLDTPLIVENGAALYIPENFLPNQPKGTVFQDGYWLKCFSQEREHWQLLINKLKPTHQGQFRSFSDMTVKEIASVTGLDEKSAELASQRQFGEPLLWLGTVLEQQQFIDSAKKLGAQPLIGGRFLHICGDSNKGKALLWLQNEYKRQHPDTKVCSIALGDGGNDIDMLEVADIAVRIASPVHAAPKLERTQEVYTSVATGPQGWREIMDQLIPAQ